MASAAYAVRVEGRSITQERHYDAPLALVWSTWTEPRHLDRWWGPNGFRNETHSCEFKVGGTWRFTMHGPDGKAWPNWVRYSAIVPERRLEYGHGGEGDEAQFLVTVTFEATARGTRVLMQSTFPSVEVVEAVKKFGALQGGQQTMARLSGFLPHLVAGTADGALVLSRVYPASVETVFAAWSTGGALAKWWGPRGFTLPEVEVDFRAGGQYRMAMADGAGGRYPFHGEYVEIVPNERIVFTAHLPGIAQVIHTTVTFMGDGETTLLTVRQTTPPGPAGEGQREGWSGSLEKLGAALG